MEILIENACGLDVHKDTAVACIMGIKIKKEIRTFKTTTARAIEVIVKCRKNQYILKKTTGNIFEGGVKVTGNVVNIGAKYEKGNSFPVLLRYKLY